MRQGLFKKMTVFTMLCAVIAIGSTAPAQVCATAVSDNSSVSANMVVQCEDGISVEREDDGMVQTAVLKDGYYTIDIKASEISASGAAAVIQTALDEAKEYATAEKPYKIKVAAGTYALTKSLFIYSNTYLYTPGVTFKQSKGIDTNMIKVGERDDQNLGYFHENITLDGGVWNENNNSSTAIKVAHAKNFVMKNTTIKNVDDAHMMEVVTVDGFTAIDCTFSKQTLSIDKDKKTYEAIQFDIMTSSHFVGYRSEVLPIKNVLIDGCTFYNVPRGVGSHSAILNVPVDGIKITNCTFDKIQSAAIQTLNWKNCEISNNTITNSPRGIAIYSVREGEAVFLPSTIAKEGNMTTSYSDAYVKPDEDQNISVHDNNITCVGKDPYAGYEEGAIIIQGSVFKKAAKNEVEGDKIPKGNYFLSGVTVTNNTITSCGHGIRVSNVRGVTVKKNKITHTESLRDDVVYFGIQIADASTGDTVEYNTIKGSHGTSIFLYEKADIKTIQNNTISKSGKYGIDLENSASDVISNNKITSCADDGIYIYNKSTVGTIQNNEVTSAGMNAMDVDASTVTEILNNTITKPKSYGIYLHNDAAVTTIDANTLTSPKQDGIDVDKATAQAITNNTIATSGAHGIYLHNKAAAGTIKKNTITAPKQNGIFVDSGATVKLISKNKLSMKVKGVTVIGKKGISLIDKKKEGTKVTKIDGNAIASASDTGIDVDYYAKATTISNNKISSPKKYGIYLHNRAKVTTITANKITSAGKNGIDVDKATIATLSKNTITSPKATAVYLHNKANAGSVKSNVISKPGKYGIFADSESVVKNVTGNKITKSTVTGIYVYGKAKVTTISSNKVVSAGRHGIDVDKATATTIAKNTVTSPKATAIYLHNKAKAAKVNENTLSNAGKQAIFIDSGSTAKTISGNKIDAPKVSGIYVFKGSKAETVEKNTITKPGKNGIDADKSTITTISQNTVTSPKAIGIAVRNTSSVGSVVLNKISNAATWGISVSGPTKVTKITKNTLIGKKSKALYVSGQAKVKSQKGNTMKTK